MLVNRRKNKISNLVNGNYASTKIPETIEGVVISSEILDRMFDSDDEPKPAIYGGIVPTKEIIDFMMIPAGFRTFSKMRYIDEEVRAEECATHERWRVMSDSNSTPEELRSERHREQRKVDMQRRKNGLD